MLINVNQYASNHWPEYLARDIELLEMIVREATKKAAEIASEYSIRAANEILERGL